MFIIAEIGINHDGDVEVAKRLIDGASTAGADAIKFQYRNLDRAYYRQEEELADSMLKSEIKKNFLSVAKIKELVSYAKSKNIAAGISFFCVEDVSDFSTLECFDFFKIPSAEFQNDELISTLLLQNKGIYISMGCQTEASVERSIEKYVTCDNVFYMHCVSNYPVMPHNSNLGYIKYFREKYNRAIGFSSHERDWQSTVAALALGASYFERHITLGEREGLDETTSSTVDEFKNMVQTLHQIELAMGGYGPRTINQGELLNFQNLGRSYFAKKDYEYGDIIKKEDLVYASPAVGLGSSDVDVFNNKPALLPIAKGSVLVQSMFEDQVKINDRQREFCRKSTIALPIRLHDQVDIASIFDVGNYEFHLSYAEVNSGLHDVPISKRDRYSIHLPDYVGPLNLIDPFCVGDVGDQSLTILNRVSDFAKKIQDTTGKNCPIVGSFSVLGDIGKREFYEKVLQLCDVFDRDSLKLLPQWLPPIAWYFGGSVELNVFNSSSDVQYLDEIGLEICFDSSHFLMCHHAGSLNSERDLDVLLKRAGHIHISGADGVDGEGASLIDLDDITKKVIHKCMLTDCMKVIETWQGHLDNYAGFHSTIIGLTEVFKK